MSFSDRYRPNPAFARLGDDFSDPVEPAEVPDFDACITPAGALRVTPAHLADKGGADGFYIARLRKIDTP